MMEHMPNVYANKRSPLYHRYLLNFVYQPPDHEGVLLRFCVRVKLYVKRGTGEALLPALPVPLFNLAFHLIYHLILSLTVTFYCCS